MHTPWLWTGTTYSSLTQQMCQRTGYLVTAAHHLGSMVLLSVCFALVIAFLVQVVILMIYGESLSPEDPTVFSLLRIAPFKYATLWSLLLIGMMKRDQVLLGCLFSRFLLLPRRPWSMAYLYCMLELMYGLDEHLALGLEVNVDVVAALAVGVSSLLFSVTSKPKIHFYFFFQC